MFKKSYYLPSDILDPPKSPVHAVRPMNWGTFARFLKGLGISIMTLANKQYFSNILKDRGKVLTYLNCKLPQ